MGMFTLDLPSSSAVRPVFLLSLLSLQSPNSKLGSLCRCGWAVAPLCCSLIFALPVDSSLLCCLLDCSTCLSLSALSLSQFLHIHAWLESMPRVSEREKWAKSNNSQQRQGPGCRVQKRLCIQTRAFVVVCPFLLPRPTATGSVKQGLVNQGGYYGS